MTALLPIASCRTCAAAIIWTVTESGKRMPVDAVPPLLGGNVELIDADKSDPPIAKVHGAATATPGFYVSHFATCAQADQHRKSKRLRPDGKRR